MGISQLQLTDAEIGVLKKCGIDFRRPSQELLKRLKNATEAGINIFLQTTPIGGSAYIREKLEIDSTAYVVAVYSGSRKAILKRHSSIAVHVAAALAESNHIVPLSGGGNFDSTPPKRNETGMMGLVAYEMCSRGKGNFIITDNLALTEGIPNMPGNCICIIENGEGSLYPSRQGALVVPADSITALPGYAGTAGESLTAMVITAIDKNSRAKHRTIVFINPMNNLLCLGSFGHLMQHLRLAKNNGGGYSDEQVNNSVFIYNCHGLSARQIGADIKTFQALAHMRAARLSPTLVSPITDDEIRSLDVSMIKGDLLPILFSKVDDLFLRKNKTWSPDIERVEDIAKRRILKDYPVYAVKAAASPF